MQNALSEVELSAVTSEHVFGERHSEALEDLRMKQLKLAQAWARSEADEVVDAARGLEAKGKSSSPRGSQNVGSTGERVPVEASIHRNMDEETERDILLARERREANDRYFDRVNNGVLEVVAKLEEVAQAMRAVERESKDIWSDNESIDTTHSAANTS
jgi:septum formation topological specificity factor MinE